MPSLVGGPSSAVPEASHLGGHPLFIVASHDSLHHKELVALHVRLDGVKSIQIDPRRSERAIMRHVGWLEERDEVIQHRTLSFVRRVDGLSDYRVADSIAISELQPTMATVEERFKHWGNARVAGGNARGAGGNAVGNVAPEVRGCTYKTLLGRNTLTFSETEGAVGLSRWIKKIESVFQISKCAHEDKVRYGDDIDGYTNHFHELAALYPSMVTKKKIESLMDQVVRFKAARSGEANKTKWENPSVVETTKTTTATTLITTSKIEDMKVLKLMLLP
ncbi:hypothetical protein Tco_0630143 [Tanacetum coccineum]